MADIHISSVLVTSSVPADIHVSAVTVTAVPTTLEPYQEVTLPSGTWVRTSGPAVTITGGRTFTAPATPDGGALVLTESAGDPLTFTVLPHTIFVARGSTWVAGRYTPLVPAAPSALVVGSGRVNEGTVAP
jgi:hypothetical protein